jgi:hypothetical protein
MEVGCAMGCVFVGRGGGETGGSILFLYHCPVEDEEEEEEDEDGAGRLRRCWLTGMPRCTAR